MDQVIRYARNPEKTTEASGKKLHEIEGIVDYAADELKTERCTYVYPPYVNKKKSLRKDNFI